MTTADKDWIQAIKEGGEAELNDMYLQYREEFIAWSSSMFKLNEDEAADVFQDAVITLYWNIKSEKLQQLTSSVKTYLFAIGKNLALKKLKKDDKLVVDEEVMEFNAQVDFDYFFLEYTERQEVIARLLKKLGKPCSTILKLFYFDRFTMDAIAQRLAYKNEYVVKTQKLRCLQKLREMFDNASVSEGDI